MAPVSPPPPPGYATEPNREVFPRATSIDTAELYRTIEFYANQSADVADSVEPIEQAIVEAQMQLACIVDGITQLLSHEYYVYIIIII